MTGIPFDAISAAALASAPSLLADWFPHGKRHGREFKIGSIRGEPGESLSINLNTGVWKDFASNESGADLIDLRAAMSHGGDKGSAARELAQSFGISVNGVDRYPGKPPPRQAKAGDWIPMVPPPHGTAPPPQTALSGFDAYFEYTDATDRVTHYVGRIEARNGRDKQFIPLTYGTIGGVQGWHRRRPANPLALYGLNRLAALPEAGVILCEGEKSADAALALFPDRPCLSWFGGTGSVEYADLTPLQGRQVIIWPDADEPGHKAAAKLAAKLPSARILRVDDLPDKFDAANLTTDDPDAWLTARLPPPDPKPEPPPRGTAYGRLQVLSVDDIDTAAPRDYLLKGLLSPNEISIWVGPPKCGKSFLLLYVAYMLSLSRSVFRRRVKPTKVLYVAAEGEGGIDKRIRALRDKYGPSANFNFIAQPIDLLRNGGHKLEVIDAATATGAQLIVIDTLNRAIAGGDENSSQDMGVFIGSISDIKCATKAHVAVIHHGTKASNGSRPRGHSSLEGADDALVEIQKLEDGSRVATVVHAKDDADGMRWGFTLDVVELGIDDDGDAITTLIVREMTEAPERAEKAPSLTKNEQIALACFDKAMKAEGILATVGEDHEERQVVQELGFRRWFYAEAKPGENQNTKRQAFNRAVEGLQAKGRLACRDSLIWRPDTW
jgi:5S rRNA maturation endonuclease (ribonuclease M5)